MADARDRSQPTDWQPADLADFRDQPLALKLAMVGEARELFGKPAAQRVWVNLGLPDPSLPRAPPDTALVEHIRKFAEECVERDLGASSTAAAVFTAYRAWSADKAFSSITQTAFGKAFARLGIRRRKSHSTIYLDIRLAAEPPEAARLL